MIKGALISMTKAYVAELAAENIQVKALLPGLTETKFAGALFDNKENYEYALQKIPMKQRAVPEKMADAVLYLVSDASSYTTGTVIVCDDGELI